MKKQWFGMMTVLAGGLLVGSASASTVAVPLGNGTGESGTQVGAGAFNTVKNGLSAQAGTLWGVANTADVAGMLYATYSDVAGAELPGTIQAGIYTFTAAVGNNGDGASFAGLNDLSSGTNTAQGVVAGFFTTLQTGTGAANSDKADANKNNMHTEFNAVSGVTYTPPTEADPGNDAWTTWTFTWEVAEGSPVIGTDPYIGVYVRTGANGGGNGFWDDSTLAYISAGAGNIPPSAFGQEITLFPDSSTNLTLTGSDFEGSELTYEVTGFPANGSLVTNGALPNLIYTPDAEFQGIDTFTFIVNDGEDDSEPATITITVTNQAPTAASLNASTFVDADLNIILIGTDPDNGPSGLTYDYTAPAHGSLSGTAPNLIYTPDTGYVGDDSFTYTVNDGLASSAVATVSITVKEALIWGPTISVNFYVGDDSDAQADHELTGSEAAGLNNSTNWNNINCGNGGVNSDPLPTTVLSDDSGNTSAATLEQIGTGSMFVGYAASAASAEQELGLPGTDHDQLFNSYLGLNDSTDIDGISITGLGPEYTGQGYKLIIYADTDRRGTGNNPRQSEYTVTPFGESAIVVFNEDDDVSATPTYNTFDGTYIESDGVEDGADYSNYVVVSNLTASSFTIAVRSPDGGRGGISGFQIVANAPLVTSIENFGV
ncbi:Ig-like domain-containing protein, partial [Pontiella sp.]|uniref:Ig-like domain-containing protein n=1 Tax=Pontiella sp. TaxID=2837462 RepID=UPI0035651B4D